MEDRKRSTVTSRNNQYYIHTALCTSAQSFVQPVPQRYSLWFNQNSKHTVLGSNSTPISQSWVQLTLALPPPIPGSNQYSNTQPRVNLYSHHPFLGQPVLQPHSPVSTSTPTTQSCVNLYSHHTVLCHPVLPPRSLGSISTPTTQSCVETVQPPHSPKSTSTPTM